MITIKKSPAKVTWGAWFNGVCLYSHAKLSEVERVAEKLAKEFMMKVERA